MFTSNPSSKESSPEDVSRNSLIIETLTVTSSPEAVQLNNEEFQTLRDSIRENHIFGILSDPDVTTRDALAQLTF